MSANEELTVVVCEGGRASPSYWSHALVQSLSFPENGFVKLHFHSVGYTCVICACYLPKTWP